MNEKWFTLVEMSVFIVISSIIIYWVFSTYEMIANFVYKSDKSVEIYWELDNLKKQISKLESEKYWKYAFSSGSIFTKSNYWFEVCLLTDKNKENWLILWVINNTNNKLTVWSIDNLWSYSPFITEISSWSLSTILSTNNISDSDILWIKQIYNTINILKLSCDNINGYFEFDITIIPNFLKEEIWTDLDEWNKNNRSQIPLTIIP